MFSFLEKEFVETSEIVEKRDISTMQSRTATRDCMVDGMLSNSPCYIAGKRMSTGNRKLGKNILIFSLPAGHSCPNHATCYGSCYARKAERLYATVRAFRTANYWLASHKPEILHTLLNKQLSESSAPFVRIHESGDFFGQTYVALWRDLINAHPEKRFYAYTKANNSVNTSVLSNLRNCNIVYSYLPGGERNYGSLDYITGLAKKYHTVICPYGLTEKRIHCGTECTACMTHPFVLFKKH